MRNRRGVSKYAGAKSKKAGIVPHDLQLYCPTIVHDALVVLDSRRPPEKTRALDIGDKRRLMLGMRSCRNKGDYQFPPAVLKDQLHEKHAAACLLFAQALVPLVPVAF